MDAIYWIPFWIVAFILLYLILASFFTVRAAEVAVITRSESSSVWPSLD